MVITQRENPQKLGISYTVFCQDCNITAEGHIPACEIDHVPIRDRLDYLTLELRNTIALLQEEGCTHAEDFLKTEEIEMKYAYECTNCGATATTERLMERRNDPLICPACKHEMYRVFTPPQLITDREVDKPENKYAYGFSDTDKLATMKAEDIAYEKKWQGKTPSKPKKPKPFVEFAKEQGLI